MKRSIPACERERRIAKERQGSQPDARLQGLLPYARERGLGDQQKEKRENVEGVASSGGARRNCSRLLRSAGFTNFTDDRKAMRALLTNKVIRFT